MYIYNQTSRISPFLTESSRWFLPCLSWEASTYLETIIITIIIVNSFSLLLITTSADLVKIIAFNFETFSCKKCKRFEAYLAPFALSC